MKKKEECMGCIGLSDEHTCEGYAQFLAMKAEKDKCQNCKRLTDEIRLTEIKRRALFNECVRLYCGQEMRLGEAQIRADMIMDRAVAAVSDKQESE